MTRGWSAERWAGFDAARAAGACPSGSAVEGQGKGAGKCGGRGKGADAAQALSGKGKGKRKGKGNDASEEWGGRFGGHKSEYFARMLGAVQRQQHGLAKQLDSLSGLVRSRLVETEASRGRTAERPTTLAERSTTPLSSTGAAPCAGGGAGTAGADDDAEETAEVPTAVGGALCLEEWKEEKLRLEAALQQLSGKRCVEARAAVQRDLESLGPEPKPPLAPTSPWSLAQRARRAVLKLSRRHRAAQQAQAAASAAAAEADRKLAEADARLKELTDKLAAAQQEEAAAVGELQASQSHTEGADAIAAERELPAASPLAPVLAALGGGGKISDVGVASALETLRLAIAARKAQEEAEGAGAAPRGELSVRKVPQRPPWADADATAAGGESADELDDAWADEAAPKRAFPDDALNSSGGRVDDGWETRKSRCRRFAAEGRARSADASPGGGPVGQPRHAGSSRSPCRGEAPAIAEVRRATASVQMAIRGGAFEAALPSACGDLVSALEAPSKGAGAPTPRSAEAAQRLHPVFVAAGAAGGREYATC